MKPLRILLGLALACLGFVSSALFLYYGWQMRTLSRSARAEPQQISADALIKNGPGDNLHVEIANFQFGKPVIDQTGAQWDRVWVPIIPQVSGKVKIAAKPVLFFRTTHIRNQAQLDEFLQSTTLHALVSTGPLKKSYWGANISSGLFLAHPNIDLDKTFILSEPAMDVPLTTIVLTSKNLMDPMHATMAFAGASVFLFVGLVGSFLMASHEQKPSIEEATCRVDRSDIGRCVTTTYISAIPRSVVNPAEVQKQRELLATELEQSSHDYKVLGLVQNIILCGVAALVLLFIVAGLLTSGASAAKETGPSIAMLMGVLTLVAFTVLMYMVSSNLDRYFHRASRIQVCASGLRWMQGRKPRLAAWLEIASAERVALDTSPTRNVAATQFGLIGALAVAMSEADNTNLQRTSDSLTIVFHNGEKLFFTMDTLTEYRWFADSVHQWHGTEAKRFDPNHNIEAIARAVVFPGRSNKTMLDYRN